MVFIDQVMPGKGSEMRRKLATVAGAAARARAASLFEQRAAVESLVIELLALLVELVDRVEKLEGVSNER